jgi:glutaredoxin 3
MSIIDEIKQKIGEKPVFIISKEYCPFCVKAKDALKSYNIKTECIEVMEIENNPNMAEIQDFMKQLTGGRSVPRVFIGGKFIGGGDETMAAHKNGSLGKMLKDAGAL